MSVQSDKPAKLDLRHEITQMIGAFNAHDVDGILSHFTDDVVWEDPSLSAPALGKDAARAAIGHIFTPFRDFQFALDDLRIFLGADGTSAVSTWTWTATMTGPIDPPGYAPTGKTARVSGACRYEFRAGKISNHTVIYDLYGLMAQLGLVPGIDSVQVKAMAGAQRLTQRAVTVLRTRPH